MAMPKVKATDIASRWIWSRRGRSAGPYSRSSATAAKAKPMPAAPPASSTQMLPIRQSRRQGGMVTIPAQEPGTLMVETPPVAVLPSTVLALTVTVTGASV